MNLLQNKWETNRIVLTGNRIGLYKTEL